MAYVAVKGGTEAIAASIEQLQYERMKGQRVIEVDVIKATMRQLIDQVMSESSLYDRDLAALAIKQAEGSMEEAVFLLRAYRSTLPRHFYTRTANPEEMFVERRISASFKDIPGGQVLGATTDYTHRLLDERLATEDSAFLSDWQRAFEARPLTPLTALPRFPKVVERLREEGLFPTYPLNDSDPKDVTTKSIAFPTVRSERLQVLTRGQTGAVTALGYAAIRGYGAIHPTVGELRVGQLPLAVPNPFGEDAAEDDYYIGAIQVTEVESFIPHDKTLPTGEVTIEFEIGYGVCFGQNETKAIAMSILDEALERGNKQYPTNDEEFVLLHIDTVESTGFISHLKLPHYVTFQSKLDSVRQVREEQ